MRRPPTPLAPPSGRERAAQNSPTSRNGAEPLASGRSPNPTFVYRSPPARNERPQAPRTRDQPGRPIIGLGTASDAAATSPRPLEMLHATRYCMRVIHGGRTDNRMPRPKKSQLRPYEDDRPDLDQPFTAAQAPTTIDFGRKPGEPMMERKVVKFRMRADTLARVRRRAKAQGLRAHVVFARLLEAYGNREVDLQPHPSGIKVVPHRTTFTNPDNPSNR